MQYYKPFFHLRVLRRNLRDIFVFCERPPWRNFILLITSLLLSKFKATFRKHMLSLDTVLCLLWDILYWLKFFILNTVPFRTIYLLLNLSLYYNLLYNTILITINEDLRLLSRYSETWVRNSQSSIPGTGKNYSSSSRHAEQHWGATSLLTWSFRGHLSLRLKEKERGVTISPHLASTSSMVKLYLHSPIHLHCVVFG
jgi:hypothetical protein